MSWLIGSDSTSFWSDLKALPSVLTTGNLSTDQKADIAKNATLSLSECQADPTSPRCQDLLNQNLQIVNTVAPDEKCVLRLPAYGCIETWDGLFSAIAFIVIAAVAFYFLVISYPILVR